MTKVIELLQCLKHNWVICIDLKMVAFLLCQQRGYTKYPRFLCLWDSRAREKHWVEMNWPPWSDLKLGYPNILQEPLVDRKKIIFPDLRIKLGLMKQFVKALPTVGDCFKNLILAFPRLSIEKIKAGVFECPLVRQLIKDEHFVGTMSELETNAWISFKDVKNFLGNTREKNSTEIVQKLLKSYKALGCNMSIKVHFLVAILLTSGKTMVLSMMNMVNDSNKIWRLWRNIISVNGMYIWWLTYDGLSIKRDCPQIEHSKKTYKRKFLPYLLANNVNYSNNILIMHKITVNTYITVKQFSFIVHCM